MKDKIISWIVWSIIWGAIVFSYWYFMNSNVWDKAPNSRWVNMELTEDRLEKMSERSWISKEEIQKRINSGESMRDIMWWKWREKGER